MQCSYCGDNCLDERKATDPHWTSLLRPHPDLQSAARLQPPGELMVSRVIVVVVVVAAVAVVVGTVVVVVEAVTVTLRCASCTVRG